MLDLISYKVLSFDCYGTLIDWEEGILSALSPLLSRHNAHLPDDRLLELYGGLERKAQQQAPFVNYHNVLRKIIEDLGDRLGFSPTGSDLTILAESLKTWAPFPDTIPTLQALKESAKLAIISNVDRDLFAHSAVHLQVPFDHVITFPGCKNLQAFAQELPVRSTYHWSPCAPAPTRGPESLPRHCACKGAMDSYGMGKSQGRQVHT